MTFPGVVGEGILLGFGLCCVFKKHSWGCDMLRFEKERGKDFLWLWSSKANVGGETGVKQNENKISLCVCACCESWMWDSVSRLSGNQRI